MSDIDFIVKQIEDIWNKNNPDKGRQIIGYTGRGGAILGMVSFHEAFSGKKYTKSEWEAKYKEMEESQIWEDGMYQFGGEPYMKYIGLEDTEIPDGTYLFKRRNLWYVELWKNHWRTDYKIITEEEAQKILENPETKRITYDDFR